MKKKQPRKTVATRKRKRSQKSSHEPSLMKYEIFGIFLICFGLFATVTLVGVDTGAVGNSIDDIFSYIFGICRIFFTLSLLLLGMKYIMVRKPFPLGRNWAFASVLYALFLGLVHLIFIPQGAEFNPTSLRVAGGIIGGCVSSVLHSLLGGFGAFLVIIVFMVITVLLWKRWSISKPVTIASERASHEMERVSEKAVSGIQEASRSMKEQWHEHRHHIYDVQKEEDLEWDKKQPNPDYDGTTVEKQAYTDTPVDKNKTVAEAFHEDEEIPYVPQVQRIDFIDYDEHGEPVEKSYEEAPHISSVSASPVTLPPFGEGAAADMEKADEYDEERHVTDEVAAEDPSISRVEEAPSVTPVEPVTAKEPAPASPVVHDVLREELADLKPVEVDTASTAVDVASQGSSAVPTAKGENTYRLPSLTLLQPGKPLAQGLSEEARENAVVLQETLKSFNIEAKVTNASEGPSVTRYELEPAAGVRVSRIVGLADDIALNLAATQVFIEAPIPGKAAVGIEVPNKKRTGVNLRDVLESDEFQNAASGVPVSLGKDIAGKPVIADLTKMPHLLVAGTTGSGKSVCINTFIASILFKQRPEDVKLVLIDPKVVELSIYNGIPHLMTPVVTDPKKAANALRWAVREMDDRYRRFSEGFARDIKSYNEKYPDKAMPYVVIIIDEMADLMMAASSDVEDSICRLAQKARACGMHLVLATQRPSVDVITGLIKANIPSRIAFRVSSQTDSRTILDMGGAEKLIGNGDMFYFPTGAPKPIRVQGAFIADGEIEKLVTYIKNQNTTAPTYDETIQQAETSSGGDNEAFFEDELMPQAIDMVLETGQASSSMLQRRFRVGFTRAARMIDTMEAMGIVGPNEGNKKPREIIMSPQEVQEKFFPDKA